MKKLALALLGVYLLGALWLFTQYDVRVLLNSKWGLWLGIALMPLVLIVRVVVEGGVYVLIGGAFKLFTLFQIDTEWTHPGMSFPWYGLARDSDGRLVASENLMVLVVIAVVMVAAGLAWVSSESLRQFVMSVLVPGKATCR